MAFSSLDQLVQMRLHELERKVKFYIEEITSPLWDKDASTKDHQFALETLSKCKVIKTIGSYSELSLELVEIRPRIETTTNRVENFYDICCAIVALKCHRATVYIKKKQKNGKSHSFYLENVISTWNNIFGDIENTMFTTKGEPYSANNNSAYCMIQNWFVKRSSSNKQTDVKKHQQKNKSPNLFTNTLLRSTHLNSALAGTVSNISKTARGDGYFFNLPSQWFDTKNHLHINPNPITQHAPEPETTPFVTPSSSIFDSDSEDEETLSEGSSSSNYTPSTSSSSTNASSAFDDISDDENEDMTILNQRHAINNEFWRQQHNPLSSLKS
jgi:hypothetical protein